MAKQTDLLAFGEYRPDLSDLDGSHTKNILNVLPQGDGYGPVQALAALTAALSERVRGYFYARDDDGTITVFAGTSTKLWMLSNTDYTWSDVSRASPGTYTALSSDAQWSFAQFGLIVLATQANDNVQSFTLGSSSVFDDLSGSPPDAAYVAVVSQFVVLSGLTANPFRIQWSAIGSATGWTAGTNQSDYQDLPDGGTVRHVDGGDLATIFQDQAIRRMTYAPGSAVIFQIDRIAKDIGLLHPLAIASGGSKIFFLSTRGFMMTDASGGLAPIGAEKVDRTFLSAYDSGAPQFTLAAVDPRAHVVMFTYRRLGESGDYFTNALAYNWLLERWSPISLRGEYITTLARPGLTIEGLDAIAPGALTITGLADNGSGAVRVTVSSTSGLTTGDYKTISGVSGSYGDTGDVNGTWEITVINGTTFDLVGSTVDVQNVTGTASGSGGKVRLTVASTAAWTTGDKVVVASVGGTSEANGNWVVTVINGTTLDLDGSTYANAWTSGGTIKDRYDSATDGGIVGGSTDLMDTSWDAFSTSTLPNLSVADVDHKIAFFTGDTLEATLETSERSGKGSRLRVKGFWPQTDAASVYGKVGKRETIQELRTYTSEVAMSSSHSYVPTIRSTRYATAFIRIPADQDWTFASGVRPDAAPDGEF